MKIKKNGEVINLTESDLKKIVKKVLSEQDTDTDYKVAADFAKSVEDWWGGSSDITNDRKNEFSEYHEFFKKFQGSWSDSNDAAAISYKNKVMIDLKKSVNSGNVYYKQLKGFIDGIIDQIDDLFQNDVWLHLSSTDGRSSSYKVDAEIDV